MIKWNAHGAAFVGAVTLANGRRGQVVVVGPRDNPKGASLVVASASGNEPVTVPLSETLTHIRPKELIEILAAQERCFGSSGLLPLEVGAGR